MTLPTEARPRSPQSPSYDTPSRLQGVLWASPFLLLVYGLGLWGYWQYRPPGSVPGEDGWDLAYYALQLFVLEFTATDGTPVPLVLKIARVVAPVILTGAVVTIIEIVRTTLLVRRLTRRGFALVVGDTAEARAVAEAKRRLSDKAVYEFATGDLVSPQALRAVGIRRADAVYALGDDREDVAANVATALAAVSARRARRTRILVHVTDPELVIGLRARRFMTEAGQLVEFFTMDEAAARAHVAQESFPAGEPPRILVAGAGAFGQAVVVEVARRWRDTPGRGEGRVEVVLVDASASAIAARLRERWVVVDRHCHLTPIDTTDPTAVLRDQPVIGRPHRAYICYEDEQVALRTALAAVPLWHGGPGSLVVRLSQLARHAEAFRTGGLLDDLEGRLVVANVADLGAPEVVRDRDIFWQLAEVVHERYLRNELAKGRQLGSTLALRPWAELRDDFRDNNYEQACHLAVKLRRIGATVAPRSDRNPPFALTDEEIEVLARLEHERWMANRRKHRWRYGPQRDDTRRIHPDLVPWEDLSEQSRQRDRDAVAAIPAEFGEVLAEFGLQIVRLAPTPASVPAQAVAPAG